MESHELLPATRLLTISRRFWFLTLEKRSSVLALAFGRLGLRSSSCWALAPECASVRHLRRSENFVFPRKFLCPQSSPGFSSAFQFGYHDPTRLDCQYRCRFQHRLPQCCCQEFTASTTYIPNQNDNHVPFVLCSFILQCILRLVVGRSHSVVVPSRLL
jgi:hypothetical protein